jgi:hypothetical protein
MNIEWLKELIMQYEQGLITKWELAQALINECSKEPMPQSGSIDENTGLKHPD